MYQLKVQHFLNLVLIIFTILINKLTKQK
jgi:hypothetical protein